MKTNSLVSSAPITHVPKIVRGPETAQQRLQFGRLDIFAKCEGEHKFWTFKYFLKKINFTGFPVDKGLPYCSSYYTNIIK